MPASEQSMRVLFLSDHIAYADGVIHGATMYFLSVLPRLASPDVDLSVCFLRERLPVAERLESQGVTPIFLNRRKWDPRALTDLLRIIEQRNIQIVHAAGMKGILLGRIASRLKGCRSIIHLHDTASPSRTVGCLQRCVARWSDLALVVSRAVGDSAINDFRIPQTRVHTLYNPVDLQRFSTADDETRRRIRRELGIADNARVIGMTGRLSPEKGHERLIRAMPDVLQRCPNAVLLIVGDGPLRRRCEHLVEEMNLKRGVRFTGRRDDIPDLLAAMDIVTLPSTREGMAYSALEAMAAGRAVVAFAVGGLVELFDDGETGMLAPPNDTQALVTMIAQLLNEPDCAKQIAANARRVIRNFSVSQHIAELKVRYRNVLDPTLGIEALSTCRQY